MFIITFLDPNPLPGFQSYPVQNAPGHLPPNYGATTVVISQPSDIIIVGGCPACRVSRKSLTIITKNYDILSVFISHDMNNLLFDIVKNKVKI